MAGAACSKEYGYVAITTTEIFIHISPEFTELAACKTKKELIAKINPIVKILYPHLSPINFVRCAWHYENKEEGCHFAITADQVPF